MRLIDLRTLCTNLSSNLDFRVRVATNKSPGFEPFSEPFENPRANKRLPPTSYDSVRYYFQSKEDIHCKKEKSTKKG